MSRKFILDGKLVEGEGFEMGLRSPGLAYGFGIFETIRFRGGTACFLKEHFERLRTAAKGAGLPFGMSFREIERQARQLFEANKVKEGVFKIVVSAAETGVRVAVFVREAGLVSKGEALALRVSEVRKSSQAFTSRHKTLNYMENLLELRHARAAGYDECLFLNEFANVTECCMSNFCFVSNGALRVPALACGLLNGIIRAKLLEMAKRDGMAVEEGAFGLDALREATEAFVTNSGAIAVSVNRIQMEKTELKFSSTSVADRMRARISGLEVGSYGEGI